VSLLVCGAEAQSISGLLEAGCDSFESNQKYLPINMPGLTKNRTKVDTATECQKRCVSVSGCAHFSFWPDGGCHLQDGGSSAHFDPEVIAGSPTSRNLLEFNLMYSPINMPGLTKNRAKVDTATECQKRCASVSDCAHFSFWPDGGCHLQDRNSKAQKDPHVVVGPPTCPGCCSWRPLQKSSGSSATGLCSFKFWLGTKLSGMTLRDCWDFCSSTANCKYATYDHNAKNTCMTYSKCDPDNMDQNPLHRPEQTRTYALEVSGRSRRLSASRAGAAVLV